MRDLLFPATDAGVLVQVVVVAAAGVTGLYLARRRREIRVLVIGMWLVTYAGIGVRALH